MLHNIAEPNKARIIMIISLNTFVVYDTRIICILSPPNWICFEYKAVLTMPMDRHWVCYMWDRHRYD